MKPVSDLPTQAAPVTLLSGVAGSVEMNDEFTCCGRPVATPFCPHCGRKAGHNLGSLLAHLRKTLSQFEQQAKAAQGHVDGTRYPNSFASPERRRRDLERAERAVLRWRAWVEIIEKLCE